ncbi:serine hydrolase domain-containing protein [Flavobacterium quisquiliarum]|uniref:Serine hydrolase domain-containing protein n=1 Tax=Flavobacterium quisquiliarum TaxID=1834436 RepID=A0ABV8WBP1_9FLAO|nr:serine hydrolase domain-containing protein [Flavobacterium quisquiliarum]MBW1654215.1 serine hydrolase [Flavobacterium quisquiliarum]NWL00792.1 serine hydrolase [Flavobacterium collinsii]
MNFIPKISLLLLFILSSCHSSAQKKDDYQKSIDSLIQNATNPVFNGVVLISKNGKTVYSKAKGYSNFETKKPLTLDSQFEIMSLTRQITAALILKEVEKGKINLHTPIKKYLPNLKQTWADTITIHQLLNHSHGITDLQKPLLFKPGSDFKYGNEGYPILGQILESVSQKSYSELANDLFKKLKMNNTFCYSQDKDRNLVTGYMNNGGTLEKAENNLISPYKVPSSGLISTVNDLLIWNNNLHKGKILKPESYKLMTSYTIKNQHNFFGKEKEGYGYGLRIIEKEPIKYFGHTGLGNGFSAVNLYFPESDVSMIVLENQMPEDSNLFYASEFKIKNILLKVTY